MVWKFFADENFLFYVLVRKYTTRYFLGRQKASFSLLTLSMIMVDGTLYYNLIDFSGNATCLYGLRAGQETNNFSTLFLLKMTKQYFQKAVISQTGKSCFW